MPQKNLMLQYIPKFSRILLMLLGAAAIINAVALLFIINYNAGLAATFLVGLILLFYGVLFKAINKILPKWIKAVVIFLLIIALSFVGFLHISGANDSVTYNEDAIIVLGAAVKDSTPSATLQNRLKVAVEYHKKNPEAVIIVSGGQGPQENISEAEAMETYLISKGIPTDKIIKEDKSTSTYENLHNSKEILDEHFKDKYTVAYVTNEYHVFRAGCVAETAGFNFATHIHSTTQLSLLLPSTLRECMAIVKFWLFNN